jgi:hypothetical protein
LGRLGWTLRHIQRATGVRRETAADFLRASGIEPRSPGRWGRQTPARPAIEVPPDSRAPTAHVPVPEPEPAPRRSPSASACEPYREVKEIGLGQGRNAKAIWQDLVDDHGFRRAYQSVKRFVGKLRGTRPPEARVVIKTPPAEETQVDYSSGQWPLSAHAAVRADARLQSQVDTPAHLSLQYASG